MERTLDEILTNWHPLNRNNNPEFHGRREVEDLMKENFGFHYKDDTWIVKTKFYVYIFNVWYKAETSMFPQSENNEIGVIEYCFKFDIESFASALQSLTRMSQSYDDIMAFLKPKDKDVFDTGARLPEQKEEGWEKSWEIVNQQLLNGVNPHAYRLGYLAAMNKQDKESDDLWDEVYIMLFEESFSIGFIKSKFVIHRKP